MAFTDLTPAGKAYAEAHKDTSILARIALGHGSDDWPSEHVEAAIKACNLKGKNTTTEVGPIRITEVK